MLSQLDQLKSETKKAEKDFHDAVRDYLLNPLETNYDFNQAMGRLTESTGKYRIVLDTLRQYLAGMQKSDSLMVPPSSIERAIASLNAKDAALERLLKKANTTTERANHVNE
ncbi:MAG: hypothetical protein WAV20_11555 [Blastocatellia bacterium]